MSASALRAAPDPRLERDFVTPEGIALRLSVASAGTRAAAFAFGVLQEIDRTRIRDRGKTVSLLDRVDFVSGVSGGSVLAAYYGLRRREALTDFRERFLLRNAEESLNTRVSIMNLSRAIGGGLNDATHLPRWLDDNLFGGATFRDFGVNQRPRDRDQVSLVVDRHQRPLDRPSARLGCCGVLFRRCERLCLSHESSGPFCRLPATVGWRADG